MNAPERVERTKQASAAVTWSANRPPGPRRPASEPDISSVRHQRLHKLAVAVLRALRLYGGTVGIYAGVAAAIRPDLLGSPLSGWWPEVDRGVLGVFGILLAGAAWAGLEVVNGPSRGRDND